MEPKTSAHPENPVSQPIPPADPKQHAVLKPKSSKWLFIAVAVIVILILGGAAVYFLNNRVSPKTMQTGQKPTVTPTQPLTQATQWKTYTNTKYNYTINYPGDWSVSESPNSKNGAGFNPPDKPSSPDTSDAITISVGQKVGNMDDPFEDYVKIAASVEIQNYNTLASLKKITTTDGIVGYETTWMVQPMTVMGRPPTKGESESLPITYFEAPNNKALLLRVYLNRKEDMATYEKMLKTVKNITPLNATPTPTVNEADVLKYVIKKYIALKHRSDENSLTLSVSKIEGDFAQGGVSDESSGGMWFAAKEDGVWKLVWEGNGTIDCGIFTLYPNFPKSMIPECYDEATQNTVVR